MDSIVQELQKSATDPNMKISNLLRLAYSVSRKIKDNKFESWIDKELEGYGHDDELPTYRKIRGIPKYHSDLSGYTDVNIKNERIMDMLSNHNVYKPISELEDFYDSGRKNVVIVISPERMNILEDKLGINMPIHICVSNAQIKVILDAIRSKIFKWTVDLENSGLLGENINIKKKNSFNSEYMVDKRKKQIYKSLALLIPSIIALNIIKSYFTDYENLFFYLTMVLVITICLLIIYYVYLFILKK